MARAINYLHNFLYIFLRSIPIGHNELVRPVHNRMPVILRPEDEEQWLDASRTSFAKAWSLLKPLPAELMDAHDVSTIVNSAKYDGPECIEPVSDDEIRFVR
jgi:putative SOS response-associated peptidase YedK